MSAPMNCGGFRSFRSLVNQCFWGKSRHCANVKPVYPKNAFTSCQWYRLYASNTVRQRKTSRGLVGVGVVSGLTCACGLAYHVGKYMSECPAIPSRLLPTVEASVADDENSPPKMSKRFNFMADVVEKVGPAVVYLEIQGRHPFHGGIVPMSNGSGFIVRSDGLILTNAHVVANKHTVRVRLQDGRTFDGTVQAVDPVSDLATVRVQCTGLPTIKLGDSSKLRPGEFVVAMGSPFQLSNTVTMGIVSTVNRGSAELGIHHKDMDYIQTDAVINDGEAIGINTMKVTAGISFAIPSDYARNFLQQAGKVEHASKGWFSSGKKKRRYMGITMLTLTPSIMMELRQRMDRDYPDVANGVLVHKVVVGSPAFNAGIQPGDIITCINKKDVLSAADVYRAVEEHSDMQITVRRGSDTFMLSVRPEEVD